ncbi:DUF3568 family protein [Thermodesulfobacteriota bacterium]
MRRTLIILILLACQLFTTGCPVFIAGAGIGAGVYTYVKGELKRAYNVPMDQALQASTTSLDSLKITTDKEESDGIQNIIHAKRTDGTPVILKLTMLSPTVTEISVRTGAFGYWDRDVSELIHATIAQRLQ